MGEYHEGDDITFTVSTEDNTKIGSIEVEVNDESVMLDENWKYTISNAEAGEYSIQVSVQGLHGERSGVISKFSVRGSPAKRPDIVEKPEEIYYIVVGEPSSSLE